MRALCVGGAHSVWRDVARVEAGLGRPWDGLVIACNEIGIHLPRLDAWVTLHPERLLRRDPNHDDGWPWARQRRERGYPMPATWSHSRSGCDHALANWSNGSSGLLAVGVALQGYGCGEVVCCGIRLDAQRNHFRDEKQWQQHNRYRAGWKAKADTMRGRVYGMSGWVRDLLGEPPWLEQRRAA